MQVRTEETVGGETLTGNIHAPIAFAKGRVCGHGGCDTQLSIYNHDHVCSLHLERVLTYLQGVKNDIKAPHHRHLFGLIPTERRCRWHRQEYDSLDLGPSFRSRSQAANTD